MNLKESSTLKRTLKDDGGRYRSLMNIFDQFKKNARVAADPAVGVEGISIADEEDGSLLVNFAGVRVRISFRFERSVGQGWIDATDVGDVKNPRPLGGISFNGHGDTNVDRKDRFQQGFSLHNQSDCVDVVLNALDLALGAAAQ